MRERTREGGRRSDSSRLEAGGWDRIPRWRPGRQTNDQRGGGDERGNGEEGQDCSNLSEGTITQHGGHALERQTITQTVTSESAHNDGTSDWVLCVLHLTVAFYGE